MVKIKLSKELKIKSVLHGVQGLLLALTAVLTLVVLTKDGSTDGRTKFVIALCFITIIPLIYLAATPQWQRTRRFANVYACVALDTIFAILWLAAAIAIGTWNADGINTGYKQQMDSDIDSDAKSKISKGCSNFAFGPTSKCRVSKASVAPALITFILFMITTALSVRLWKTGELNEVVTHAPLTGEHPDDAEWSHELGNRHEPDGELLYEGGEHDYDGKLAYGGGGAGGRSDYSDGPGRTSSFGGDLGVYDERTTKHTSPV